MRTKSILALLMMTAATLTLSCNAAEAANVNVNISGYLPPPPGVYVQVDAGRPYYVQHDRRVYMERRPGKHNKHYKEKRHHDNGNKYGHYKDEERGGHGEGGHGEGGHGGGGHGR
jgi:hypothetical protein